MCLNMNVGLIDSCSAKWSYLLRLRHSFPTELSFPSPGCEHDPACLSALLQPQHSRFFSLRSHFSAVICPRQHSMLRCILLDACVNNKLHYVVPLFSTVKFEITYNFRCKCCLLAGSLENFPRVDGDKSMNNEWYGRAAAR